MTALKLPERLQNHRGFARTFQPGKLTLGLIAPFKGYPDSPVPEMDDFATVIKAADQSGIATLWVRDVPFYDPSFGDVAQIYDPSVTLGYLAALTQNVALGSAGYVSPLREPILTAQEAASAAASCSAWPAATVPPNTPPLPPISTTAPNATAKRGKSSAA
mgnify:CR=1 FL=1